MNTLAFKLLNRSGLNIAPVANLKRTLFFSCKERTECLND